METRPPSPGLGASPILRRLAWGLAWGGLLALALAVRSFEAPFVFVDADTLLDPWDGAYHARRAFYSFAAFPQLLTFDPYLRFPDGAPVPYPPLYDWLVGVTARLFVADAAGFARFAAWVAPVLSTLTLIPIHLAARRLFDPATAWWACLLFALFPASVIKAPLGDLDHHAAVALWIASAFYYLVAFAHAQPAEGSRTTRWWVVGIVLRVTIATTWTGSLLALALLELGGAAVALSRPRPSTFGLQAIATLVSALGLAAIVAWLPTPIGGAFSSTELSWLHVLAMIAVGGFWLALWFAQRRTPVHQAREVLLRAATTALGLLAALLSIPAVRASLAPGFDFVAGADAWAPNNAEQAPLFAWLDRSGRIVGDNTSLWFGYGAWLIPLLPFLTWLRGSAYALHPAALTYSIWTALLGALAIAQVRYGSDFAPLASIGMAATLLALGRGIATRTLPGSVAFRRALTLALFALCMHPVLAYHSAGYDDFRRASQLETGGFDRALLHPDASLVRFAEKIRRSTPETSGYLDANAKPEYSILAVPSFGHILHWTARRPTPANNFGPYLDAEKMRLANLFFGTHDEAEALDILDRLGSRYALTMDARWLSRERVAYALHRNDGDRKGRRGGVRGLRLITESDRGAKPSFIAFGANPPRDITPYKLWERVPGAVLEAIAEPGDWLEVDLPLITQTGRRFRYRAAARADADGRVHVNVPYATEPRHDVRATGPYTATLRGRTLELQVEEAAVLEGGTRSLVWD